MSGQPRRFLPPRQLADLSNTELRNRAGRLIVEAADSPTTGGEFARLRELRRVRAMMVTRGIRSAAWS